MWRSLVLCAAVCIAACFTPPKQPEPVQLHVARAPRDVVQIATRELTLAGFEIAVSDGGAGTLVAKRTKTPDDQGEAMTCKYQHGSIGASRAQATLTISVAARPASDGSDVAMNGTVHIDSSQMPGVFRGAAADKDCASTGMIEKKIADALRA